MNRPWPTGFGWLLALVVLLVAILALITTVHISNLVLWLIIGLALALIVG